MFTAEQIKAVHEQVKSGADFPAYIRDLNHLGVLYYETFVNDGHTDYYGANEYKVISDPQHEDRPIANECKKQQFQLNLLEHQQGKTDYPTFLQMSAQHGINKWMVSVSGMTCTYFDRNENEILVEKIPAD